MKNKQIEKKYPFIEPRIKTHTTENVRNFLTLAYPNEIKKKLYLIIPRINFWFEIWNI